jgi:hypothetical protein
MSAIIPGRRPASSSMARPTFVMHVSSSRGSEHTTAQESAEADVEQEIASNV